MVAEESTQVFRPRRLLAIAMATAGVFWLSVLLYLMRFDGVPAYTMLGAVFFVVFFAICLAYNVRTSIAVDEAGLTYRGLVRVERMPYREIRKLDVLPGPITVYAIRSGGRFVHFTSLFGQHQRLMQLLVQRAGLAAGS